MKFIFSIIIFALSIVIGFVYVVPEYYTIAENKAKLTEVTTTLKNKESIKDIMGKIDEALNSVNPVDQTSLSVLLPETLDEVRFADNLQNIGKQTGLRLTDIKVEIVKNTDASTTSSQGSAVDQSLQGVQKTFSLDQSVSTTTQNTTLPVVASYKDYVTTKASFSVIASYTGFLVFLASLEKSLQLINITSLSFKQYVDSASDKNIALRNPTLVNYQFSFEIETYSLK